MYGLVCHTITLQVTQSPMHLSAKLFERGRDRAPRTRAGEVPGSLELHTALRAEVGSSSSSSSSSEIVLLLEEVMVVLVMVVH